MPVFHRLSGWIHGRERDEMKVITFSEDPNKHAFFCPGCGYAHWFSTEAGRWTWNGDREKPTINPSVLTIGVNPVCHSFVAQGKIRFLSDSTHKLKGQEVDLPEFYAEPEKDVTK